MFDFTALPASQANNLDGSVKIIDGIDFTSHKNKQLVDKALNESLVKLENSTDMHKEELKMIDEETAKYPSAVEEQLDIRQRIGWLHSLYKAKEEIEFIQTKEEASALLLSLTPVQNCPMKLELIKKLESLAMSLTSEVDESIEERLMNQALEEAGDDFINMGSNGRAFIIKEVLQTEALNPTITNIKAQTAKLALNVERLQSISDKAEFHNLLTKLPLASWTKISADHQDEVISQLMLEGGWDSLMALEQTINRLYQSTVRAEIPNKDTELETGSTINAKELFGQFIF